MLFKFLTSLILLANSRLQRPGTGTGVANKRAESGRDMINMAQIPGPRGKVGLLRSTDRSRWPSPCTVYTLYSMFMRCQFSLFMS